MTEVERQYWLWVTRPDYYMDEDGCDREDLDPTLGADSDGWWTCNKATKEGDLVLLWRTSPKKDIRYLIQAESDAYSIADDNDHGWDYGCDYEVLYKFEHSLHVKDLRQNPYFDEWGPLRCSFQRSNFKISLEYWSKLNNLLAANHPGYLDFIEQTQRQPIAESIGLEKELEDVLVANLGILKNFGYNLELYVDPISNQSGRQFICKGNGGRIDLLCYDRIKKRYVVIELKNVRASQNTFGQICNYVGWVQDRIAKNVPVKGLVISRGYDTRFESALKITERISHINVEDLGFAIAPSKKPQRSIEPKQKEIIKDPSKLGTRSAKSREVNKLLKQGNVLTEQEKYGEAVACYDKVIEINPKNKWGWINKGETLSSMGKYEEAIKTYDKALEVLPQSADLWCSRGFALSDSNKNEDAIAAFDKAIEIKSNFADAWNGKGIVFANMERYEEAIDAYNKAIVIRPKFVFAWNNKGFALADQGKCEEAIEAYDEAIRLDPKLAFAWCNKGSALDNQGKLDRAIEAYNEAIEIDPQYAYAWYLKGKALDQQGKHDEAINAYDEVVRLSDEAIKLNPQNFDAWNLKGIVLYKHGKYSEAVQAFDKAIEIYPQYADAWNNKGDALKSLGHTIEADAAFAKAKEFGYKG